MLLVLLVWGQQRKQTLLCLLEAELAWVLLVPHLQFKLTRGAHMCTWCQGVKKDS
jgi:hypothetical protein